MRMTVSLCLSSWMLYRTPKKWTQRTTDSASLKLRRTGSRSVSTALVYMITNFYSCGENFARYARASARTVTNIFHHKLVLKYLWYYNLQIMYILIRKICWCEPSPVNCETKLSQILEPVIPGSWFKVNVLENSLQHRERSIGLHLIKMFHLFCRKGPFKRSPKLP